MRVFIAAKDRKSGLEVQEWITDYCEENRVQVETDFVTTKEGVYGLLGDIFKEQETSSQWFTYERYGKRVSCRLSEILYFESQEKRIRIVKKSGEDTFYGSILELERQLREQKFISCHKSLLVNYGHIAEYREDEILLTGGEVLPVSRRKKQAVMEQLQEWSTE